MTIDKYALKKQVDIHDETGSIDFQVQATGISKADAVAASAAFDKFLAEISRKQKVMKAYVTYSPEEETVISKAPNRFVAWKLFKAAFPDTQRVRDSIRKKWIDLHPDPKKTDAGPIPSDPERKASTSVRPLIIEPETTTGKTPGPAPVTPPKKSSKRESNHNNAQAPEWTDDQKDLIKKCETKEEAWTKYQEKFPGTRSEGAVHQRFNKLKKPGKKACHKKKAAAAKPPATLKKTPVKKQRLPYKMKNQQPEDPPQEGPVTRYAGDGLPHTATDEDPLDPPEQAEPETYQVTVDKDLLDVLPDKRPPTNKEAGRPKPHTVEDQGRPAAAAHEKIAAATAAVAAAKDRVELIKDMKVRQIGGPKICASEGVIKRAVPGDPKVLVGFGNGVEWIDRKYLEPVAEKGMTA